MHYAWHLLQHFIPWQRWRKSSEPMTTLIASHVLPPTYEQLAFGNSFHRSEIQSPDRDPTFPLRQSKVRRASVQINCQLSMRAQLFRQFPVFPFPFSISPFPHCRAAASRVTIKGKENGSCGRWRAAIFMFFWTSVEHLKKL